MSKNNRTTQQSIIQAFGFIVIIIGVGCVTSNILSDLVPRDSFWIVLICLGLIALGVWIIHLGAPKRFTKY